MHCSTDITVNSVVNFQLCVNYLQQNTEVNMSHSLSNWLNHIKSDDIDGGLAADFDGSLSGLGSELGSNPYNMRLLPLYVFICIYLGILL